MRRLIALAAMLWAGGVLLAADPPARPDAADDSRNFIDHFHDDANASIYVSFVDKLIDTGEGKIHASMEDEKKDTQLPRAKTPNGILMLYTVAHTPDGVLVHFSTSRAPYLPTALGKHIVGLFMARSGWPKPAVFQISENQVFHAIWMVPESQFAQIRTALPELRAKIRNSEDAKTAFLRGLLRSQELDVAPPTQTARPRSPGPAAGSAGCI